MYNNAIIIFQKRPEPGKVKTRLSKVIGEKKAVEVYRYLLDHTHEQIKNYPADIFVYFQDQADDAYVLNDHYHIGIQKGGDLGEKMQMAFDEVLGKGYRKVVIIGSDCLELTADILDEAYEALVYHDLVIGPAEDGGYYLLGMKVPHPELFADKSWSTSTVFSDTVEDAKRLRLNYHKLKKLADVDEYKDLKGLKGILNIP